VNFHSNLKELVAYKRDNLFPVQLGNFSHFFSSATEGQLIWKCPLGVFKFTKKPTNFLKNVCPRL
jgi:hypothetical protein